MGLAMKRNWLASVSVVIALSGTVRADPPAKLPDPAPAGNPPVVLPDIFGSIQPPADQAVTGDKKPADAPKPASPAVPVPQAGAANCNSQANNQPCKPDLTDYHTGPCEQIWLSASYLLWKIPSAPDQAILATDGNGNVLLGGDRIDYGTFNGIRVEGGAWFNCQHTIGLELGGFITDEKSRLFGVSSDANGIPTIIRPIIDPLPQPNRPSNDPARFVALTGATRGSLTVATSAQLAGAEANIIRNVASNPTWSLNVLAGFRYFDLDEDLSITQNTAVINPNDRLFFPDLANPDANGNVQSIPIASAVALQDRFHTRNQFYGGQIGGRAEFQRGIWFGTVTGKLALGPNHQVADLTGQSTGIVNGVAQTVNSGFLVAGDQPPRVDPGPPPRTITADANGGRAVTNWFVVMPEVGAHVGCQLSRNWRVYIGYNFLYLNNVVRPGDLVNTTVNSRFIPTSQAFQTFSGPNQPQLLVRRDDFWVHGVELGVQLKY